VAGALLLEEVEHGGDKRPSPARSGDLENKNTAARGLREMSGRRMCWMKHGSAGWGARRNERERAKEQRRGLSVVQRGEDENGLVRRL
jgi:hypothetical protein